MKNPTKREVKKPKTKVKAKRYKCSVCGKRATTSKDSPFAPYHCPEHRPWNYEEV